MRINDLRVNHIERPLGYQISPISFSWKVRECCAERAEWARVRVWEEERLCYDSGQLADADCLDFRAGITLHSRTAYRWNVEVMADNGEYASAESIFETGKMEEPWQADWITADMDAGTPAILCRTFEAADAERPRLYICGLGLYEAYLNGKKIGDEYLTPGYHSYDFHVQVQTYDVSPYLTAGTNELQIVLADGWYRGRLGFDGGFTDLYGDRCYAIAELYNGSSLVLKTDESWQCTRSFVTFSNIYDGEVFDAGVLSELQAAEKRHPVRVQSPDRIGICGSYAEETAKKRAKAILCDRLSLPIVKKESFSPVETIVTPKGETVLDFGQELTGWVEFDAELPAGHSVRLVSGEILQKGCFYHENYRTARTEFVYISDGNARHVRPHFTFFGFRYMLLEYLDAGGDRCEQQPMLSGITAWHLRSDFEQTGVIETGIPEVNQLIRNALWSQKDNFLDVPTDCPQRDERLGWTGDAQIFADTACYNMYVPAFYRKYMWDMRSEQSLLGGSVPYVVPNIKKGLLQGHGACPWGDAAVLIPWQVWMHYGSRTLLAECYPGMKAWVDHQAEKDRTDGGRHLIQSGFHFADWLALDNPDPGPYGATDPLFIASAYYYRCARIVSEAARILELSADADSYGRMADQIRKAIGQQYFDENGLCSCGTQTGSALTVAFGLTPDGSSPEQEADTLVHRIRQNNGHLNTGFVGTGVLCSALSESGHHDTAVELVLREDYPSWLYAVKLGATTIWERWNSVEPDGTINPEGMNSLNHYSYGSIVAWMYRELAGLAPAEPGFRKALIAPKPDRRLGQVSCCVDTAVGIYRSSWHYEGDTCIFELEIPFGAEAEFIYGAERRHLKPGRYVI